MKEYKDNISDINMDGSILAGVCRGKISEGIDFSDDEARLVIMLGFPLAKVTDPKVFLKK
jgi:Rad3-related DNA helicase